MNTFFFNFNHSLQELNRILACSVENDSRKQVHYADTEGQKFVRRTMEK